MILAGTYLWDLEDVRKKIRKEEKRKVKTNIHLADNNQEKNLSLGVDDHLLMSLMGNMIDDYRGASTYIDDHYETNQASVCLHCRTVDRHEEVDPKEMKQFEFLCQNQVLRQGAATHVVVAITYGAECFCVARQVIRDDEDKEEVQERLKEQFQSWQSHLEDGEVTFDADDGAVQFRLYSDIQPPSGAEHDQDCYKRCVEVLQVTKRSTVPLMVWLCPLRDVTVLSPRKQMGREISKEVVVKIHQLWSQFKSIDQLLDELTFKTQGTSPSFIQKVDSFRRYVQKYRQLADHRLRETIARVRRGAEEESTIEVIVTLIRQSAFDPERLCRWITLKKNELTALHYVATLPNIRLVYDLSTVQRCHDYSLVLQLPNLNNEDAEELEHMRLYVEKNPELVRWNAPLSAMHPPETNRPELRAEVVRFSGFISDNEGTNGVDYFVLYDGRHLSPSPKLQLYMKSHLVADGIQLPQPPSNLRVVENHQAKIRLQWNVTSGQHLKHCLIEYREQGQLDWNQVTGINGTFFQFQSLKQKSAYYFRVAGVYLFGRSEFSPEVGPEVVRAICDAPTSIELRYATESGLSITWTDPPLDAGVSISSYIVDYWPEDDPSAFRQLTTSKRQYNIENLDREKTYMIQVTADCGILGTGVASQPVPLSTNKEPERVACIIRDYARTLNDQSVEYQNGVEVVHLPIKETMLGKEKLIRHCQLGCGINKFIRKTILVVGATGAGKSTLINGMLNYILGVGWEDDFRFKLIKEPPKTQAVSQTEHVTAYDIFRMKGSNLDYSLTIVDTPGFGDTRGLERDKMIMEQIRQYFQSPDGVQELEAVCFLIQASLARLTPTQKYIYDSILSLFGKDIKDNIRLMITFADNQAPPVLEGVMESNIPCPLDAKGKPLHHKFNNSSLFIAKAEDPADDVFTKMFYEMGTRSFRQFFADLVRMKTTSLTLTKEVLLERKRLEVVVEGLQQRIQYGLNQIEEFKQIKKALTDNDQQMQANQNFNFQVEFQVQEAVDISRSGNYVTNCQKCKWTCHYPCKHANDADRKSCLAMDPDGFCRVCPGKCSWNDHFNMKFRYEWVKKKVDRSSDEIRRKYEDAQKKKLSNQDLVDQLAKELDDHEKGIVDLVNMTYPSIHRLDEIALKPHPFSAPEYIDLIIKAEQQEHRDGYLHRIETLQQLRQMAEIQSKVINKQAVFDTSAVKST